jgi:hypothetical protein
MEEDDDMLFDLEALARDRNPVVFPKPPSVKLSSTPTTNGQENAASAQVNDSAAKDVEMDGPTDEVRTVEKPLEKPVEKPVETPSSPLPSIDVEMEESPQLPPNDQEEV